MIHVTSTPDNCNNKTINRLAHAARSMPSTRHRHKHTAARPRASHSRAPVRRLRRRHTGRHRRPQLLAAAHTQQRVRPHRPLPTGKYHVTRGGTPHRFPPNRRPAPRQGQACPRPCARPSGGGRWQALASSGGVPACSGQLSSTTTTASRRTSRSGVCDSPLLSGGHFSLLEATELLAHLL